MGVRRAMSKRRLAGSPGLAASVVLCLLASGGPASAQEDPQVGRGRVFAQTHCAMCHDIGPVGQSPLPQAPPLRTLHELYPVESLEEAFAEGIVTGHPSMPQFQLDPGQIGDLIAFMKSLER